MKTIVEQLANSLIKKDLHLLTAESCTGGLIAKVCTDAVGSSGWFDGAVVAYSNEMKIKLLNVWPELIEQYGAVSEEVVEQMVLGAELLAENDKKHVAIAVTGIAGPGGATKNKPVGTVCFAWAHGQKILAIETVHFIGGREEVREQTMEHALMRLDDLLVSI